MELSDGKKWCAIGAKSCDVQWINENNNCLQTKGLTVDFNNKDTITFKAMSEVAQDKNTIPKDKQHLLHDNNIEYIQSEPRFGFGYDKSTRICSLMIVI